MLAEIILLAILGTEPGSDVLPLSADPPPAAAPSTAIPNTLLDSQGDTTVRSALVQALSRQGPLDGAWVIAGVDGAPLYNIHIVDPPRGPLEGAWRDVTAPPGATTATGVLSAASRDEAQVTISFTRKTEFVTATLRPRLGGGYAGDLTAAGAPARPVLMTRP